MLLPLLLDDRRSSRASSLSPSFVQKNTPADLKQKPKRNFIKNIRPDTFKRPSSFNLKEAEAAASKQRAHEDVMLVGYRKTVASPNLHSRVIVNSLELGTFSPNSGASISPQVPGSMSNSVSLPLLERSGWGRSSDGTLPEYMQVARRSLRAKKKQRNGKASIITVDFVGGSDPELSVGDLNVEENNPPQRLQRALTDPVRHSAKARNAKRNENKAEMTPFEVKSSIRIDRSKDVVSDFVEPEVDSDGVKKQLDFQQELCQNLSQCLTQALGDQSINDSDQSDDETFVQNGYDVFLEPSHETHDSNGSKCDQGKVDSHKQSENELVNQRPNPGAEQSVLTVRDILKNNLLQLSAPGSKTENSQSQVNSVGTVNGNSQIDIKRDVSIGESGVSSRSISSRFSSDNGSSTSQLTISDSQATLTSKDSSSNVQIISERDPISDNESELTVIELLREEYIGAMGENPGDINQSLSDFSDSGVSVMSHRNSHKASSDSNILQSVETLQTMDSSLEVKKAHDSRVTSASFPDISKLETPKEHPRLVSKVEHSTVK